MGVLTSLRVVRHKHEDPTSPSKLSNRTAHPVASTLVPHAGPLGDWLSLVQSVATRQVARPGTSWVACWHIIGPRSPTRDIILGRGLVRADLVSEGSSDPELQFQALLLEETRTKKVAHVHAKGGA